MNKMTRDVAAGWQKKFLTKYPDNPYEILWLNGNIWWSSRFKTRGSHLVEVLKFVAEDLNRKYIVINTGGHGAPDGSNASTNKKHVEEKFSHDDRK
jgi:hypothetical protein